MSKETCRLEDEMRTVKNKIEAEETILESLKTECGESANRIKEYKEELENLEEEYAQEMDKYEPSLSAEDRN